MIKNATLPAWKSIADDYIRARNLIWDGHDCEEGLFLLLKAYRAAQAAPQKDCLWHARILYAMASEFKHTYPDHVVLARFANPSVANYEAAVRAGVIDAGEKEIALARWLRDSLKEIVDGRTYFEAHRGEMMGLIEGSELLADFSFHDSKPIKFAHGERNATLDLWLNGTITSFEFENVQDICIDSLAPGWDWISECWIYPLCPYPGNDLVVLELDRYRIVCENIKVVRQFKRHLEPCKSAA